MNVVDIEENVQELVSKGFKPDTFILDFVKAYDAPKALIQQLKGGHQNLSDVDRLIDGSLGETYYDPKQAKIRLISEKE